MMTFQRRSQRCKYRIAFVNQLSAISEAPNAFIGFFDIVNGHFVEFWVGEGPNSTELATSKAVNRVANQLTSEPLKNKVIQAYPILAASALDPSTFIWVEQDGCIVGIGGRVDNLVAVAGVIFDQSTPKALSPALSGLMQMAVAYAVQELHDSWGDRTSSKRHIAEHVLGRLSFNLVVVDGQGEIVYMTDASAAWLAEAADLSIVNNRLVAGSKGDQKTLSAAIQAAVSAEAKRSVLQVEADAGVPHVIVILPIRTSPSRALVIFGREKHDTSLSELLLETYGLTRAERRLALQLLHGKTISEAAESANLTTSTARSYLKSIFAKTGSHRQSELISLCYSLMPPLKCTLPDAALPPLDDGPRDIRDLPPGATG